MSNLATLLERVGLLFNIFKCEITYNINFCCEKCVSLAKNVKKVFIRESMNPSLSTYKCVYHGFVKEKSENIKV